MKYVAGKMVRRQSPAAGGNHTALSGVCQRRDDDVGQLLRMESCGASEGDANGRRSHLQDLLSSGGGLQSEWCVEKAFTGGQGRFRANHQD